MSTPPDAWHVHSVLRETLYHLNPSIDVAMTAACSLLIAYARMLGLGDEQVLSLVQACLEAPRAEDSDQEKEEN